MSRLHRTRLLFLFAVAALAGCVWLGGHTQRVAADRTVGEIAASDSTLEALLGQEIGLRTFLITRDERALRGYAAGARRLERSIAASRAGIEPGEDAEHAEVEAEARIARRWSAEGAAAIAAVRAGANDAALEPGRLARTRLMQAFRAHSAVLRTLRREDLARRARRAEVLTLALVLAVSALAAGLGYLFIERGERAAERHRRRQERFVEALQLARDEPAAQAVLAAHLEAAIPGARVRVLPPGTDGDGVRAQLAMGGEALGTVVVEPDRAPSARERAVLATSAAQAAPVIATLRTLAAAESRAATDALTGLPNHRAAQEMLARMAAQAERTGAPLAAALFDLDHFKAVNDTFGHAAGDDALAAVGRAVAGAVRASDFVARYGGEEFLLLLPDTGAEAAVGVAEVLRGEIAALRVPGVDRPVTASFGVAVLPAGAGGTEALLRAADRALYAAKANGRDRVEAVARAVMMDA